MGLILYAAIMIYGGICAFVCSRTAYGKNRGADEWFVCGEILGVIAVAAILLLPRCDLQPEVV